MGVYGALALWLLGDAVWHQIQEQWQRGKQGMNRQRKAIALAVLLGFLMGSIFSVEAAEKVKIPFRALEPDRGMSGEAVFSDSTLTITAKGLKPNAAYFVWFVNMQPTMEMAGVGKTPNQFETDEKGAGRFTAKLETSPFGKWQALTIVEHPQIIKDTLVAELTKEKEREN